MVQGEDMNAFGGMFAAAGYHQAVAAAATDPYSRMAAAHGGSFLNFDCFFFGLEAMYLSLPVP